MSINPIAFVIVQDDNVKLIPINHSSIADRLIDFIPDLIDKICNKSEIKNNDEINKIFMKDNNNENNEKKSYITEEDFDDLDD